MQENLFSYFNFTPKEIFYTRSQKNVIRGMHFQKAPFEVSKVIIAVSGSITDVLLDIRKGSETFGKSISINISDNKNISSDMIAPPPGLFFNNNLIKKQFQ
jgi:dTDP-4-dehydrorhamnose 3,5-epimerase-like enzyme